MWQLVFVTMGLVVVDGRTLIAESNHAIKGPYISQSDCNKDLERALKVVNRPNGKLQCVLKIQSTPTKEA